MGIDYIFYRAFIIEFKYHSVRKSEIEAFFKINSNYVWDYHENILYKRSTKTVFYDGRYNGYLRRMQEDLFQANDDGFIEDSEGEPFFGMEELKDIKEEVDISDVIAFFGKDKIIAHHWAQIGYTH